MSVSLVADRVTVKRPLIEPSSSPSVVPATDTSAESSLVIVPTPCTSVTDAPTMFVRSTKKDSSDSIRVSPLTVTSMVVVVEPFVSVPLPPLIAI